MWHLCPKGLLKAKLFGHEKGAFTGAVSSRLGRFELAQGWNPVFWMTFKILSLDIQAKLLRVLEEKEFERVGGTSLKKADFRLIAATNQPLKALVAEKEISLGSLLPPQCFSHPCPASEGKAGRYSPSGPFIFWICSTMTWEKTSKGFPTVK